MMRNFLVAFVVASRRLVSVLFLVIGILLLLGGWSWAQSRYNDVLISVVKDRIVAVSGTGQVEQPLSVGESVISTKGYGVTAVAITTTRLLGFSSTRQHWSEQPLGVNEHVIQPVAIRDLVGIIATNQHLFGFRALQAHWSREALGINEQIREVRVDGHVGLVVTTRRLVGLSAFVTGFHTVDLQGDEQPQTIEHTGDAYLVRTPRRTVIFRSRVAGWRELN